MKCPHCREKLLQKSGTQTRVRTDGPVTFDGDMCRSRCYWCKADVTLPLRLSEQTAPNLGFVIRRNLKTDVGGRLK